MAPSRATRTQLSSLIFLSLFIVLFLFARVSAENPSAEGSRDLICHTENPAECYPRIFEATDEFQTVHDDQHLPPGLHIKLDIYSGKKEAKLVDPNEVDSSSPQIVEAGVDMVLVDQGEDEFQVPIPKGAPAYEAVGQIKEPPVEEAGFSGSLVTIKRGGEGSDGTLVGALENLVELSSDIYYGLKISEDAEAVKALLCLMSSKEHPGAVTEADRQAAARILGGALQNNPKALAQVEKVWEPFMQSQCYDSGVKLTELFHGPIMPARDVPAEELGPTSSRIGSTVFAIKGLLQSRAIRDEFIASGGMSNLVEILIPDDEAWAPAQRKVGILLLDTFLDVPAGATWGVWPRGPVALDSVCKAKATCNQDGCWEYHIGRIQERNKADGGHWSIEVNESLKAARKFATSRTEKTEL